MFKVWSGAFSEGEEIPVRHTCRGENLSPALEWSGAPEGTKSFALIVDDPDAPDPEAPKQIWVHWVVYNIPPQIASLPEGARRETLPSVVREGLNDASGVGYTGPCPPIGRHRYFHRLYALDRELPDLGSNATRADLDATMAGHVLATAVVMGTFPAGAQ